jgi:type VI secretion system secreted protein VgrG
MPKFTQKNRAAAVGTPLAEDHLLLRGMSGYDAISQPFNYTVEMLSVDSEISFEKLLGESLTIRLNHVDPEKGGPEFRFFNGIVADLQQHEPVSGLHSYHALLVPWFWFLTKSTDSRIFQGKSVPEILAEVFKLHGFESKFEERLSAQYPKLEYCVQYCESDFAFASRLMEEVGIYYFFTHKDGKHTMVLADSKAAHDECPGFEEMKYIGPTGNATGNNEVTSWEMRKQVVSGGFALTDFNFSQPQKKLYPEETSPRQHNLGQFQQYQYEGEYIQDGGKDPDGSNHIQLEDIAKIRLQALQSEHDVVLVESDCRGLQAGHTFTLSNCFRKDQDGKYFITSLHHQLVMDDFVSGSGGSEKEYECSFTAISDAVDYRTQRTTPKPRVAGPQTAIVVGRSGEEIDTDKYGRVKVQFHWDRESKADETSSCWVRVSQNWAGKKWGAIFIPRIGQEVIVDFLEGDPDRPIITGRVYNGDNMPPYDLPAEKTKSTIKSHSSKDDSGFNELRFDDKAGKEQIFMHAEKDMDVRVKNNYKETNYGHRDIRVGWKKDGKSGGNFNTLVREDENRHIEKNYYELVDEDSHQTVKGERTEKYEKSQKTYVQDDAVLNADRQITETKTAISLKTDKYTLQGASGVHVKGQTLNFEASNISLKCGGSFVHIGPAGVDIKGPMVKINSGGSAKSADAPEALPEIEVLEPFDAAVATNSKSGGKGGVVGKQRTRGGGVIAPQLAPKFTPPLPVKEASPIKEAVTPPPAPVSEKPCGIKELEVSCGHGRKPGASNVLQVVADGSEKDTYKFDDEKSLFSAIRVAGEKSYGGQETISVEVVSGDGKQGGEKSIAASFSTGSPPDSKWKKIGKETFSVDPPVSTSRFPLNAKPECLYVHGKGCDEITHSVTIEQFPNQNYKIQVDLKFFTDWVNAVNKAWEDWGEKVMAMSPVALKPKIIEPAGSLSAAWGWEEEKGDWRAYFGLQAEAGLDPVIGIGIEIEVSALKLAGAAFGIPPAVADLGSDHIADILLAGGAEAKGSLKGRGKGKFYATGEEKLEGRIALEGSGKVYVKLTARVGSKYLYQASMEGSAHVELKPKGELTFKREGMFFSSTGELDPCVFGYKIETRSFYFFNKSKEEEWKIWDTMEVWKTEPKKLLPE